MFQGEFSALGAAALWALATILYGRLGKNLSPLVLNLLKGLIALGLLLLTLALTTGQLLPTLSPGAALLLGASGAVGIGLGDTAYFGAVNALGARRALLLEMLAPPLSALMALAFLQEYLSGVAWLGIVLTLAGVAWVISERSPAAGGAVSARGVGLGLLAALGQSAGAVLSRAALADTAVDPLGSSAVRLAAGLVCIGGLLVARGHTPQRVVAQVSPRLLAGVAIAAFFGTYLAIWLQQTALKLAPAGIAQALLATSPIMVLPMALALGDRVTLRAAVGAAVALAGVWLLFIR